MSFVFRAQARRTPGFYAVLESGNKAAGGVPAVVQVIQPLGWEMQVNKLLRYGALAVFVGAGVGAALCP